MISTQFRQVRRLVLAALALAPLLSTAQTTYPGDRPVSILVPYAPGGATDAVARILGNKLGNEMRGTFVVENKPGGSGTIAMSQTARAKPDGHTLIMNEITSTVVSELVAGLTFDPVKDLTPAVLVAETPFVLVINSDVPAKTLQEFIAYARANPHKVSYGSGGVGSGPHIAGELFKRQTGAQILHVPYRGSGPAVQDLLGGQIQMLITAAPTVASLAGEKRMRPLAVAGNKRLDMLPDVPTAQEAGLKDFVIANWFGLAAPAGTSQAVLDRLNQGVNSALKDPEFLKRLDTAGAVPLGGPQRAAAQRVSDETQRWGELMRASAVADRAP